MRSQKNFQEISVYALGGTYSLGKHKLITSKHLRNAVSTISTWQKEPLRLRSELQAVSTFIYAVVVAGSSQYASANKIPWDMKCSKNAAPSFGDGARNRRRADDARSSSHDQVAKRSQRPRVLGDCERPRRFRGEPMQFPNWLHPVTLPQTEQECYSGH